MSDSEYSAILVLSFVFGAYYVWYATNKVGSSIKARIRAEKAEAYKKAMEEIKKWKKD